jgi:hypothetical protein
MEQEEKQEVALVEKKQRFEPLFLKYHYTPEEKTEIAERLAQKTQALARVEDDKKSAAAQFKSQAESIQKDINLCAVQYQSGYEMRDIECRVVMDYEAGLVRHYRTDNGDLAQERKLTQSERQMRLDEFNLGGDEDVSDDDVDPALAEDWERRRLELQYEMQNEKSAL